MKEWLSRWRGCIYDWVVDDSNPTGCLVRLFYFFVISGCVGPGEKANFPGKYQHKPWNFSVLVWWLPWTVADHLSKIKLWLEILRAFWCLNFKVLEWNHNFQVSLLQKVILINFKWRPIFSPILWNISWGSEGICFLSSVSLAGI